MSLDLEKMNAVRSSASRLEAVRATGLVDQPESETLARLSRLAAQLIDVPVTFLSLVESDRDFYATHSGLTWPLADERQLAGTTFCHLTLVNDGPLVIDDTHVDPLHRSIPTVASLGVRAYLGIPVRSASDEVLGAFCAVDFKPRKWSERDQNILHEIALSAQRELSLLALVGAHMRETMHAQSAQEALKTSATMAQKVLHAVAHDLRNPIATISLALTLIARSEPNPKIEKSLAIAERQVKSMQRMLDDLLDGARIDSGRLQLNREIFPVRQFLQDMVDDFSEVAKVAEIGILVSKADERLRLYADKARIGQIIGNLVSNALKFTGRGGAVRLSSELVGQTLEIRVADSGTKIADAVAGKLFEPFWQADTASRNGLGLGLSIARTLVELHGGTILLCERDAPGNEFLLSFPATANGADTEFVRA
ncbi:MAG: GAF domain-containing sensor histidine kinase [Betaproteobacteria bacterium]